MSPSDHRPYLQVVRDVLQHDEQAGLLRLPVVSDSMRPLLRAGDWIWIEAVTPADLRLGDIIVVQNEAEWITHRIVAREATGWRTHGDNTRVLDRVAGNEDVVGRVNAIERGAHRIDLQAQQWQTANRWLGRIDRVKLRVLEAGRTTSFRSLPGLAGIVAWPFQVVVQLVVAVELKLNRGGN